MKIRFTLLYILRNFARSTLLARDPSENFRPIAEIAPKLKSIDTGMSNR